MKEDHIVTYYKKYVEEEKAIIHSFDEDLTATDTLASCTATVFDSRGNDTTVSMIDDKTVNATNIAFDIKAGTSGETYQIKLVGISKSSKIYTDYITLEVFGQITLNSNLADHDANSYVSLKQANDYIRNKYGHDSVWDSLSTEGKKRLLIEAARSMGRFNFIDDKYYDSQALDFPRDTHDTITDNCGTPITNTSFRSAKLYSTTYGKFPTSFFKYGTVHITAGTPVNDIKSIASSNVLNGSITIDGTFSATPTTNTTFRIFYPLDRDIMDAQCEEALYIKYAEVTNDISPFKNLGAKSVAIGDVAVSFNDSKEIHGVSPITRKLLSRFIKRRVLVGRA